MAGLSIEMQMLLYVILIAALAFAGYYIGAIYGGQYEWVGMVVGGIIGVLISFGVYKWMEGSQMTSRQQFGY